MGLLGFGLLLMFGAKAGFYVYWGGGAVGLWSQLKCICGGPPSPLHRGPSLQGHDNDKLLAVMASICIA